MSIVEKALKKLYDQRETEIGKQTFSVPSVDSSVRVETGDSGRTAREQAIPGTVPPVLRKMIEVSNDALRLAGMLSPESQEARTADEYRQIKRPLKANAVGRGVASLPNGNVVVIASALPGEGKTFTSINLALSMAADHDISVLLVDADIAKPHVSRMLGIVDEPGLVEVLCDEQRDIESLVIGTNIPGLSLLSAGRRPADSATELLASSRMEQLVKQLTDNAPNRIVLMDSPPLLLTGESRALAHVAGQIVLVVRAGVTPQQSVLDAISYLEEGKFVGVVLNQSDDGSSGSYYGYGNYGDPAEPARR